MKNILKLTIFLTAGLVATGCATPQSQELLQAQTSYSSAENDPAVTEHASVALYEAQQALNQAQNAESLEDQKHFAYLAQRKIELARINANQQMTKGEVAMLQAQQKDFLLALRAREAKSARTEADQAQQQLHAYRTQDQQAELDSARQQAQLAQAELETLRKELADMEGKQTDAGLVLTLKNIVFETDKSQLKTGAERGLERVAEFLQRHPDRKVLVEGFTDSVGSESYNEELSQRRAKSVARAFQTEGISLERITTRGHGEQYPVATNNSAAGRQQNRRVEITILNPDFQAREVGRGQ